MRAGLTVVVLAAALTACRGIGRTAVRVLDEEYVAEGGTGDQAGLAAKFDAVDASKTRIDVKLVPVVEGLKQITDLQFPPGASEQMVVLQKTGTASVVDVATGAVAPWFTVDVATVSEQGLLGLAFHPDFASNGRFYTHTIPSGVRPEVSRIAEWVAAGGDLSVTPTQQRVLLDVRQPYQNHNAGQLAFGPDGLLYIALGDGGLRADPDRNGQNGQTLLGSMLRIDVNGKSPGKEYGIPSDNPGASRDDWAPEAWAIGLRNPWRFSFAPDGRLVVADVGQDTFEEVTILTAGSNAGWVTREARHCFPPGDACEKGELLDPIHEYPRSAGQSITGGAVYTGTAIGALTGKYVFADFVTGRIWALDLPDAPEAVAKTYALGKYPILVSAFGTSADGALYVADYGKGTVYRFEAP